MSLGIGSTGGSPRPLSKVRTNFVTVGRNGQDGSQLGLKKQDSVEPIAPRRRTSFTASEEDPAAKAVRKESIATEFKARKESIMVTETIPESAIAETPAEESNRQLGNAPGQRQGPTGTEENKVTLEARDTPKGATQGSTAVPKTAPTITRSASKRSAEKAVRSPPKTPIVSAQHVPRDRSTKTPDSNAVKKPTSARASSVPAKSAITPKSVSSSTAGYKTRIPPSPPQTGFHKPKPRSPTRPVKLPASLTAHTASSGSKTAGAAAPVVRQSLGRVAGNQADTARATQNTTELGRKSSVAAKSRPSLGPPPAMKESTRKSSSKDGPPAGSDFLARLSRPTTASASKTHEIPANSTVPKRAQSARRPVTRDGISRPVAPKVPKTTLPTKPLTKAKETIKPLVRKSVAKDDPAKKPGSTSVSKTAVLNSVEVSAESKAHKVKSIESLAATKDKDGKEATASAAENNLDNAVEEVQTEPLIAGEQKDDKKVLARVSENDFVAEESKIESAQAEGSLAGDALPTTEKTSDTVDEKASQFPDGSHGLKEDSSIVAIQSIADGSGTINDPVSPAIPEPTEKFPEPIDGSPAKVSSPLLTSQNTPKVEIAVEAGAPSTENAKPGLFEDPADIQAREEMEKMNAALYKISLEDEKAGGGVKATEIEQESY